MIDLAAAASISKSAAKRQIEDPPSVLGGFRRLLIAIDFASRLKRSFFLDLVEQVEPFLLEKGSPPAPNRTSWLHGCARRAARTRKVLLLGAL